MGKQPMADYERPKRASFIKQRYLIALMATLCPVVCYMGRQNLSLAITAMVDHSQPPGAPPQTPTPSSTPSTATTSTTPSTTPTPQFNVKEPAFINGNSTTTNSQNIGGESPVLDSSGGTHISHGSCPRPSTLDEEGKLTEVAEAPSFGPKYDWGSDTALVLGAFYWTYVFFQIPGARLAESLGAKWILAAATLGTSLLSLLSPLAASKSVYALFCIRLLMGVCQAALYPACYVLYSHWMPPTERSNLLPLLGVGAYIGSIVAFSASGYFIEQEPFGWPYAFYLPSVICALWSVVWIFMGASEPRQSKYISLQEIDYIESRMETKRHDLESPAAAIDKHNNAKKSISWTKLAKSRHIWAMMVAFFASNWSFTTVLLFLPTYLKDILHVSPVENGFINSIVYVLYVLTSPIVGAVSTMMIESRPCGISRLNTRKLFQGVALFGQAACFLALPWIGCDAFIVKGMFFAMIIMYSFVNGGEVQIPTELSVDFAGTIYAIGNCVGSSTGFIVPLVYGLVVEDFRDRPELLSSCWNKYFYITASVSIAGGLIFTLFGRNDMQDFSAADDDHLQSESQMDISKGSAFNLSVAPSQLDKYSTRQPTPSAPRNNIKTTAH